MSEDFFPVYQLKPCKPACLSLNIFSIVFEKFVTRTCIIEIGKWTVEGAENFPNFNFKHLAMIKETLHLENEKKKNCLGIVITTAGRG